LLTTDNLSLIQNSLKVRNQISQKVTTHKHTLIITEIQFGSWAHIVPSQKNISNCQNINYNKKIVCSPLESRYVHKVCEKKIFLWSM
jgi:hypothetical protein